MAFDHEAAPPVQQRRWVVPIALVVGVALIAGIGFGVWSLRHRTVKAQSSATFAVSGTFTFIGDHDASCQGSGGYSDIGAATQVTVSVDQQVLGFTELGPTNPTVDGCIWSFTVPNVPSTYPIYTVEVGRRGGIHYSKAQVQADEVALTLGD